MGALGQQAAQLPDEPALLEDSRDQVLFAVEVVIKQPRRDGCRHCDVLDRCAVNALRAEHGQRRVNELFATPLRLLTARGHASTLTLIDRLINESLMPVRCRSASHTCAAKPSGPATSGAPGT